VTNVGLDWLEVSCSADAQQLSACAWLTRRSDPELCESPLCIGHALSEQHAMRASGVGAQPAQTAALPTEMRTVSARANNRLLRVCTRLGCRTEWQVSNRLRSGGYCREAVSEVHAQHSGKRKDEEIRAHASSSAEMNAPVPGGPVSSKEIGPLSGSTVMLKRRNRQHWRSASTVRAITGSASSVPANRSR
jgi:hypothetical protein